MELKKENLHMDQIKCLINTQMTLEEDKNISDRNPDAASILMEKGRVVIEDSRPGKDFLSMKGKLIYEVLYASEGENGRLYRVMGEIPWEEKVRAEGMESTDSPQIVANIEDLRSSLINSRKINIRGLLNFCIQAKEIRDEEILTDIGSAENIEVKKEGFSRSVIAIDRKDVFRIKEDLELPASLPSIGEVLWKYVDLGKWEIRPLEETIGIQGELKLFILYESSKEEAEIKAYETTIPFSGNLECPGSNSCMVADITPTINYENINIKQDYDGEDRVIEVEMVLDIPIQMYERREVEQITDVYGTALEITPEYGNGGGRLIHDKYQGRVKVTDTVKLPASHGKILQICHVNGNAFIEDSKMEQEGLKIDGILAVTMMYMTDHENRKYEVLKKELPFTYIMNTPVFGARGKWKITPMTEQISGVILDENHVEIKSTLNVEMLVEEQWEQMKVTNVKVNPYAEDMGNNAPGIVVYIPEKKESLWDIGKRYCVSLKSIKEINGLNQNEVEKGQKILLVKENC